MNVQSILVAAVVGSTLASTNPLSAQDSTSQSPAKAGRWELTIPSGTLVPTGVQRDAIKRGDLTAVQLMYAVRPTFAITSTFGWARSKDVAAVDQPKLDVFTYDIGAEARAPQWLANETLSFSPFAGIGAGGRTYNYRKLDVDATHNLAAYASAGGDVGVRRLHLRLEARDYVAGFKPLVGSGAARTSNDVVVMVGLRLVSR
jgi:hypothetical protein